MNKQIDRGDEVYPRDKRQEWSQRSGRYLNMSEAGITRRNWLAGLAAQGMLASESGRLYKPELLADRAYEVADALIAKGRLEEPK